MDTTHRDELPQELKMLEQECNSSQWLNDNELEPCVGDLDCPNLAEGRGIRGKSLYTAFVVHRSDGAYGCYFPRCFPYRASSLDDAIRHQREHHFYHTPFVCVPHSGNFWYVLTFLLRCPLKSYILVATVVSQPNKIL